MKIRRMISVVIIWSFALSNLAFAQDYVSKTNVQEMLAPVVHIDAGLFQQGYDLAAESVDDHIGSRDVSKKLKDLILVSDEFKNNPVIQEFFEKFEDAFQKFQEGDGYIALYEAALKAADYSPKIYANPDVRELPSTAVDFWRKSLEVLNSIDFNEISNFVPQEKSKILHLFLSFKAEVAFNLAERNSDIGDLENLENYAIVKESLEQAVFLSGIEADAATLSKLGNACANLAANPNQTYEQQIALCQESLLYFETVIEDLLALSDNNPLKQQLDAVYYSYFTTLYFTGDVYKANGDYKQAISYYDQVVPLVENLSKQPKALEGLKGFYLDYYRMLWAVGDALYFENEYSNGQEDNRRLLYTKTRAVAGRFIELLSSIELAEGVGLDPLACIAEVSDKLASESLKHNDLESASRHLGYTMQALKDVCNIKTNDQHDNFLIAKNNVSFILRVMGFIKKYVQVNGISEQSIAKLAAMFDPEFFADFIARLQTKEYQIVLEKFSKQDDPDIQEQLTRDLFVGSMSNSNIRSALEKVLKFIPADKTQRDKFNKAYGYLTMITLISAYTYEGNYALAKQILIKAADKYSERFEQSSFIAETILPQAALDKEKGREFVAGLFRSFAAAKIKNSIINNKDSLSQGAIALLRDIAADPMMSKVITDNKALLEVIGIKEEAVKAVIPEPAKKPVIHREVVQTVDVLKRRVDEALVEVKAQINASPKRASKKGNKKSKHQVSFNAKSSSVGLLRNKLKAMTDSYAKRPFPAIIEYLKNIVVLEESAFKNPIVMRVLVQAVMNMEQKTADEILSFYAGIYSDLEPASVEVSGGLQYLRNLRDFENNVQLIEQKIANINFNGLSFAQTNQQLDALEKQAEILLREFSDKQEKEISVKYSENINQLLDKARTEARSIIEKKENDFIEECNNYEHQLQVRWMQNTATDKTSAEIIVRMKVWLQEQDLPKADKEISRLSNAKKAADDLAAAWEKKQKDIKELISNLSLVCENKVKVKIADDFSSIAFEDIDMIFRKQRAAAVEEVFLIMKSVFLHNPYLAVEDITATVKYSIFEKVFNEAKAKLFDVKKALRVAHEYDVFAAKYEKAIKEILSQDMTRLEKIKQVRDLLAGEFEEGTGLELIEDQAGVMDRALEVFAFRSKAIFDKQDEIQKVCQGQFELEIMKEYDTLIFTQLVKKVDMKKAAAEIRSILKEALIYNVDLKVVGVGDETQWEETFEEILHQEYQLALKEQEKAKLIQQTIAVDTKAFAENSLAIAQAI